MKQFELERPTAQNMVVAGSMVAGIALFMASITIMLAIGLLLGALVMIERIARRCNSESPHWNPAGDQAAGTLAERV